MEVSFSHDGSANAAEVEVQPGASAVPATVPASGVPARVLSDNPPRFKDVRLPRINIVHPVGNLRQSFQEGEVVYGQDLVIYTPPLVNKETGEIKRKGTAPLRIVFMGFYPTRYAEKIKGGGMGMLVDTEAAVLAAGGTLSWQEWNSKQGSGLKLFQPLADASVLIERPAHCADDGKVFNFVAGDKKYALALWSFKGFAYNEAIKKQVNVYRLMGALSNGYPTHVTEVTVVQKPANGNLVWTPNVKTAEATSKEVLALIEKFYQA